MRRSTRATQGSNSTQAGVATVGERRSRDPDVTTSGLSRRASSSLRSVYVAATNA